MSLSSFIDRLLGRQQLRCQVKLLWSALVAVLAQRDDAREQLYAARTLLRQHRAWSPTHSHEPGDESGSGPAAAEWESAPQPHGPHQLKEHNGHA